MTNPQPTPEAVQRIQALGEAEICEFIEEVSNDSMQRLTTVLPPAPGFRKTSAAGIRQRKQILARRLVSGSNDRRFGQAREYQALYYIWRAWAMEHLGDSEVLETILDKLEEFEDARPSLEADKWSAQNSEIEALFSTLVDLSHQNKCTREAIERFLILSPFSRTVSINAFIEQAKPAVEVKQDATLKEFPERVTKAEKEIIQLREQVGMLSGLKGAQEQLAVNEATMLQEVATLEQRLNQIGANVEQLGLSVESEVSEAGQFRRAVDERFDAAMNQQNKLSVLNEAAQEEIRRTQSAFVTQEQLVALSAELGESINFLKHRLEESAASSANALAQQNPGILYAEQLRWSEKNSPTPLNTAEEIAQKLATNLQSIGLKKTDATALSEEIIAAIHVGQPVFFEGSFAAPVAQVCAQTVASSNSFRISVPIGVQSADSFRSAFMRVLNQQAPFVASFLVEGINRSPIELFADALWDVAQQSAVDIQPTVFFCTLSEGVTALPLTQQYIELGPVFSLNCLDWRSAPQIGLVTQGVINKDVYSSISNKMIRHVADVDEIVRLLSKSSLSNRPRLRRTVLMAGAALDSLKRLLPSPSITQSLAYGWILPLWKMEGLAKDTIDDELAGGRCDIEVADARIAKLITEYKAGEPYGAA